ncbi:MAG: alcohol dehydrogenase catalytic domain-containing protein [Vicinamibacterales bacterium]
MVAAGAGATALAVGTVPALAGAPAVQTGTQAGRRYRAYVKFSRDAPSVVQLTARALRGREIAVRPEAAQTCYTSVGQAVLPTDSAPERALIMGHGGVGVVEAVGPQVIRAQVGDRVLLNFHSQCGSCFNCLWMRGDRCLNRGDADDPPVATMQNGTPVYHNRGSMAELIMLPEEYAVPLFTDLSSVELSMLACVGNAGLGMAMTKCPVEAGSSVVVFGAGPTGLSAVEGARVKGASQIIAVEPIRYRRELALKLGATIVVDPNQYARRVRKPGDVPRQQDLYEDALIDHLRELCKPKTPRRWAGGGTVGPDHVIEAVGGDYVPPKVERGPDPTGVTVLQQCWDLCSAIGSIVTCGVGQPIGDMVQIRAQQWADGAKHHWPGTAGGTNPRRDNPRYVKMMETGQINMKALASATYPLDKAREAYQVAGDRTVVATVVLPNG